jgi:hypothetical protein
VLIVKSLTVSVACAVWVMTAPLVVVPVAVMVTVLVLFALTVSLELLFDPLANNFTVVRLRDATVPTGEVNVRLMVPANEKTLVRISVKFPAEGPLELPFTTRLFGLTFNVKFGPITVTRSVTEFFRTPLFAAIVRL